MILLKLLGYIWAAPVTVVGLLMMVFYGPARVRWNEGCLEVIAGRRGLTGTKIWGGFAAQTFGWLIWYRSELSRRNPRLRIHERVHVKQAMILGVLFPVCYGLQWLWVFARAPDTPEKKPRWYRAYRNMWFERTAYDAGLNWRSGEDAWGARG